MRAQTLLRWAGLVFLLAAVSSAAPPRKAIVLETPAGVRFGVLRPLPEHPLPVLFLFSNTIEGSIENADYATAGWLLADQGFLIVAMDLPCHGRNDARASNELSCWADRLRSGDNFIPDFSANASSVLSYLIEKRHADPTRVAAAGISRGAFMAIHFAAGDKRVRAVLALAPVTDLLRLREFAGMETNSTVKALAAAHAAPKLAGRSMFVWIGNNDDRVGTDAAIAFSRRVVEATTAAGQKPDVELHMVAVEGHLSTPSTHVEAAAWLAERFLK